MFWIIRLQNIQFEIENEDHKSKGKFRNLKQVETMDKREP